MKPEKIKQLNLNLTNTVRDIIAEVEADKPLFTEETRTWLAEVLADSVVRRVVKFAKGQTEHGGDFLTNKFNAISAMQEEADDAFFYFEKFKYDVAKVNARLAKAGKDQL